jgi:hypothetical protein
VVEEYEVRVLRGRDAGDFLKLASSDERCSIGTRAMLDERCGNLCSGTARQLFKLRKRGVKVKSSRLSDLDVATRRVRLGEHRCRLPRKNGFGRNRAPVAGELDGNQNGALSTGTAGWQTIVGRCRLG